MKWPSNKLKKRTRCYLVKKIILKDHTSRFKTAAEAFFFLGWDIKMKRYEGS